MCVPRVMWALPVVTAAVLAGSAAAQQRPSAPGAKATATAAAPASSKMFVFKSPT